MGEWRNFGYSGFPKRDSDIYCNIVSHTWDDAIEAEGNGMNVRIWSNYVHDTFIAFGVAAQSLGPLYLYRNISGLSERGPIETGMHTRGGSLVKIGAEPENEKFANGRIVIYHNTVLQPPSRWNDGKSGCNGIRYSSDSKVQDNILSRNNIFEVREDDDWAIKDYQKNPTNDFDYDLSNGPWMVAEGQEQHSIKGTPIYQTDSKKRQYYISKESPGYDDAVILYGFNDHYDGNGPDMGAFEDGASPSQFGIDANWTRWCRWFQKARRVSEPIAWLGEKS